MMNGPYRLRGIPKVSKKARERRKFADQHPPMRCAACKSGGTLRKLDGKYLCAGCYNAVVEGRLKFGL